MVNEFVAGDWEDFQVKVGLLEKRLTPRPAFDSGPARPAVRAKEDKKQKDRRKQEKQSRKKNRKRK